MADYQPLIARAVAGLEKNTGENRRALYERARNALLAQLRGVTPALDESEITRERLALEEAIRKVEAETARSAREAARPLANRRTGPRHDSPPQQAPADEAQTTPQRKGSPEHNKVPTVSDAPPAAPPTNGSQAPPPGFAQPSPQLASQTAANGGEAAQLQTDTGLRSASPPPDETWASLQETSNRAAAASRPPLNTYDQADTEPMQPLRPPRSLRRIVRLALVAVAVVAVGAALYWQRTNLLGLGQSVMALVRPSAPAPREATTPAKPKIPDRIGQPSTPSAAALAVAQRVVLYEEDPNDPQGRRFSGTAVWRTETKPVASGRPPELAVRADIEIPDRKMLVTWSLRRNTDPSLPASHTIEIAFNVPSETGTDSVQNVPGVLMKQTEQTRGVPLAGLAVKVTPGFFLIGLSALEADMLRNVQMLKERSWFDIPIVYSNNRRAILAVEKGTPGEKIFGEVFTSWRQ